MTTTIVKPGIYHMPITDYVNDPAPVPSLNASCAHTILTQSPRHAWAKHPRLNPCKESDESSRLDLGTIAHALLLEDDDSRVVVIEAADWKTKAAREERDAARAAGKLPILPHDYESAQEMVAVAREAIDASELGSAFADATPEQTLVWEEEGIWMRCRPDKATPDWRVLFDYKTAGVSASPMAFLRSMLRYGYDLQAALNLRGVEHLCNPRDCVFVFIVQEIDPPYAVSFVSLSPQWLALAKDKLRMAMSIWKGCLRTNEWPGFSSRVAYLEAPAFAEMGWADHLPEIDAEDFI